jgi:hypothetical protein
VKLFILILTLLCTVRHFLARTGKLQLRHIVTTLTFFLVFRLQKPTTMLLLDLNKKEIALPHQQIFDTRFLLQFFSETSNSVIIIGLVSGSLEVLE